MSRNFSGRELLLGLFATGLVSFSLSGTQVAEAQVRYASQKRSNTAIAHYARARAMCVETLEEFEVGRKHARPDLLLDAEEWRLTMISLCEQLNRLVDPKIRVSNAGIQVSANPRLIHRAKDRLPEVADGPKIRNDHGEAQRLKDQQDARARMYAPEEDQQVAPIDQEQELAAEDAQMSETEAVEPENQLSEEELIEQAIREAIDAENKALMESQPESVSEAPQVEVGLVDTRPQQAEEVVQESVQDQAPIAEEEIEYAEEELIAPGEEQEPGQTEVAEIPGEQEDLSAEEKEPASGEDAKIASAIEQAIQDKLREIEAAGAEPAPELQEEDEFEEE